MLLGSTLRPQGKHGTFPGALVVSINRPWRIPNSHMLLKTLTFKDIAVSHVSLWSQTLPLWERDAMYLPSRGTHKVLQEFRGQKEHFWPWIVTE